MSSRYHQATANPAVSLDPSDLDWAVRLSEQLQTLSEVAENLTYRLLELEERFAGQEEQLRSRLRASQHVQSQAAQAMAQRMRATDSRLGHIEDLLRQRESAPPSPPSLRALSTPFRDDSLEPPHGETIVADDLPAEEDLDQSLAS